MRFHHCIHEASSPDPEILVPALRETDAWRGWDIDFAWGGRSELTEYLGSPPSALPSTCTLPESLEVDPDHFRHDAARHRLEHAIEPLDLILLSESIVLVTVITPEGRSRHHAFVAHDDHISLALPFVRSLPDALAAAPVWPVVEEEYLGGWGLVIDEGRKAYSCWGLKGTPGELDALARARPGWTFRRDPHGYAGQLAAAGTSPAPWCTLTTSPPHAITLPAALQGRSLPRRLPCPRPEIRPCEQVARSIGWDWL